MKKLLLTLSVCLFVRFSFGQQPNLVNQTILYVSPTGNDGNNGLGWGTAKATIGAAMAARPVNGTLGSGGYHYGKILVAPGTYAGPTTTPWEWNAQTDLTCVGASSDILADGCIVKSPSGATVPILSSTPDYDASGYSHYLTIHGMTFDGNGSNAPELVRQAGGGVNNVYSFVVFKNLPNGRGVWIERTAVNWTCEHCAFFDLNANSGGAVYFHDLAGLNQVYMVDIQVDRCGTDPIFIEQVSDSLADSFTFTAVKFESSTMAGSHAHIIHLKPRTNKYGNPANINVNGAWSASTAQGGGKSFAYEENQPGIGGRWHLSGVQAYGYPYVWISDKQNRHSASNVVAEAVFQDVSANAAYAYVPSFEGDEASKRSGKPKRP
jgi:hypothetical protein